MKREKREFFCNGMELGDQVLVYNISLMEYGHKNRDFCAMELNAAEIVLHKNVTEEQECGQRVLRSEWHSMVVTVRLSAKYSMMDGSFWKIEGVSAHDL